MKKVNIHQAKTHLSKLLVEVEEGKDIIIARKGKPIAKLTRFLEPAGRVLGRDEGLFVVPDDFDEPLPGSALPSFSPWTLSIRLRLRTYRITITTLLTACLSLRRDWRE